MSFIYLKDILYVLNFLQNLILALQSFRDDYIVNFHTSVTVSEDKIFICQSTRYNNLYYLPPNSFQIDI